ncbi:hypothetical protein ADK57_25255 [Streptomyces sp. MMG1533]|uniref:hypothetical protein n=1 Tax=Streptomyces sp. MMG1533 TaxID=1415546 RepID=UPI0006B05088|nr:hypothetical protein [Streptomyces sp. MMG1533]KOU62177.1 hypothetical protein ADK57_25255 [Streptomyces sp. MMG1533]
MRDLVSGGVVTVDPAAGPKRALGFSVAAITIRDLKMAVPVGPQIPAHPRRARLDIRAARRSHRHVRRSALRAIASPCASRA